MEKTKEFSQLSKNSTNVSSKVQVNISLLSLEEEINRNCIDIVRNYHSPLERTIIDINSLINLQKSNKINYIIVKQLEIREEWLIEKKVEISSE